MYQSVVVGYWTLLICIACYDWAWAPCSRYCIPLFCYSVEFHCCTGLVHAMLFGWMIFIQPRHPSAELHYVNIQLSILWHVRIYTVLWLHVPLTHVVISSLWLMWSDTWSCYCTLILCLDPIARQCSLCRIRSGRQGASHCGCFSIRLVECNNILELRTANYSGTFLKGYLSITWY